MRVSGPTVSVREPPATTRRICRPMPIGRTPEIAPMPAILLRRVRQPIAAMASNARPEPIPEHSAAMTKAAIPALRLIVDGEACRAEAADRVVAREAAE